MRNSFRKKLSAVIAALLGLLLFCACAAVNSSARPAAAPADPGPSASAPAPAPSKPVPDPVPPVKDDPLPAEDPLLSDAPPELITDDPMLSEKDPEAPAAAAGPAADPSAPPALTPRFTVLMYHNGCMDEAGVNSETVTAAKLRDDLKWLKDNGYTTMLPRELQNLSGVPEKTVIITFDDGYRSNHQLAFPLLRTYGMKALISLITYNVDNSGTYPMFLNWDQVAEMSASGLIEIGSHTHMLHNNDIAGAYSNGGRNGIERAASTEALREDLETSASLIEAHTGIAPVSFAYPFGAYYKPKEYREIVNDIFPVNFDVEESVCDLGNGTVLLHRFRVRQDTDISGILSSLSGQ